jgi:hypothetical protein
MQPPAPSTLLERRLALLSANEMVSALGLGQAPPVVRASVRALLSAASKPLARVLARFDASIDELGLARAASSTLADLGARYRCEGPPPPRRGPLLVVANHPGAYDALCLLAALERDDVAMVAADRVFLRALPALARHMCFVPDGPEAAVPSRARGLRSALRHLADGGAVVHFAAGRIEPDPAFPAPASVDLLAPWAPGTGALVRGAAAVNGAVALAILEGVHSPTAKRMWLNRLAERRGLMTFAPLLQVALRRYRNVEMTARFSPTEEASALARGSDDSVITALVRDRARVLLARAPRV